MEADGTQGGAGVIITPEALGAIGAAASVSSISAALLAQQKQVWPLLHAGYASLASVQTREFAYDGFVVKVQFNPGRITSSAAKVDEKSIRERKCFLCLHNLPPGQRGIRFGDCYVILCNPFPIFPEHFTIPHREHIPQQIAGSFDVLLDLACAMGDRYTLFYNGPRCGASAPDHLHFQAGLSGFMPIDTEYPEVIRRFGRVVQEQHDLRCIAVDGYLRRFIALESSSPAVLAGAFVRLVDVLRSTSGPTEEPMMNIIVLFDGTWRVLVFPRARHRPSFFFEEEEARILISPAAVDLGGVCITPLEKDFHKITREHIAAMFAEVTLGKREFDAIVAEFRIPRSDF
jgi:hypothetical protein